MHHLVNYSQIVPPSPFASKSGGHDPQLLWERRPWQCQRKRNARDAGQNLQTKNALLVKLHRNARSRQNVGLLSGSWDPQEQKIVRHVWHVKKFTVNPKSAGSVAKTVGSGHVLCAHIWVARRFSCAITVNNQWHKICLCLTVIVEWIGQHHCLL